MNRNSEVERIVSASLLRLRMKAPFFATLALFTHFIASKNVPVAATDGKDIFFNPNFVKSLSPRQVDGLFLHEVLHAALLHVWRRGWREADLWNVAADIVVNGMIAGLQEFELPAGGIRNKSLEHLSVEEVYDILVPNSRGYSLGLADLLMSSPDGVGGNKPASNAEGGSLEKAKQTAVESHWKNAIQQAIVVARSTNSQGRIPAGFEREFDTLTQHQLDWRSYLWRYLVQTPTDFSGFDRRFIGRKLYLEALQGESVQVFVAVDTSGSISDNQMGMFLDEIVGILNAYPHLVCELYYADADIYGPYSLEAKSTIPLPKGGGGTSFKPFFEKVNANRDWHSDGVCVYLTDGYGDFPDQLPSLPVLWVVTPGGLDLKSFPFGEAVRLLPV
ncbi:MAG TPA: VWA-like domain-containing protein [Halomicronema sp.]